VVKVKIGGKGGEKRRLLIWTLKEKEKKLGVSTDTARTGAKKGGIRTGKRGGTNGQVGQG